MFNFLRVGAFKGIKRYVLLLSKPSSTTFLAYFFSLIWLRKTIVRNEYGTVGGEKR